MNGKGRGPMKGYNWQKYADNYDQIFRKPAKVKTFILTTQPKQLKPMKTNQDGKQPAPVLAWHRIVGIYASDRCRAGLGASADDLASLVAYHDPHATTVRLLEEALPYVARDDFGKLLARAIRAHIASLQQEGAAK